VKKRMISVLVSNQPGVLMRVAGLISRRGHNIDTLAVGETEDPRYSRISIVLQADDSMTKQIIKQLAKLIEVVTVGELPIDGAMVTGIALIKVRSVNQWELYELIELFRVKVVDSTADAVTFEVTGDEDRIHTVLERLRPFGILEMVRTGMLGLQRGGQTLQTGNPKRDTQNPYYWVNNQFADAVGAI
jgi:acetolactate synthase-1/3 small subunit